MTAEERIARAAGALKVFPLPSAVLFPGAVLPLHIFEPRYRALVQDCLAGDGVMALGGLRPGWEGDYLGRPPLEELGCAGVIAWHEELPDGRFELLLQGVVRFRLLEELPPAHTYREVRAELLPEPPHRGPLDELVRRAVLELSGRVGEGPAGNLLEAVARQSGGALADVVAAALVPDLQIRQNIFRELDPEVRLQRVLDELGELIARLGAVSARGPLN